MDARGRESRRCRESCCFDAISMEIEHREKAPARRALSSLVSSFSTSRFAAYDGMRKKREEVRARAQIISGRLAVSEGENNREIGSLTRSEPWN